MANRPRPMWLRRTMRRPLPAVLSIMALSLAACAGPPTPTPFPVGFCDDYLHMEASAGGTQVRSVATSYRCGQLHVDSTGQLSEALVVARSSEVALDLGAPGPPRVIEARLYENVRDVGSFLRWPEGLPGGDYALDIANLAPDLAAAYTPPVGPGEYSLVVRAQWDEGIDIFFGQTIIVE